MNEKENTYINLYNVMQQNKYNNSLYSGQATGTTYSGGQLGSLNGGNANAQQANMNYQYQLNAQQSSLYNVMWGESSLQQKKAEQLVKKLDAILNE